MCIRDRKMPIADDLLDERVDHAAFFGPDDHMAAGSSIPQALVAYAQARRRPIPTGPRRFDETNPCSVDDLRGEATNSRQRIAHHMGLHVSLRVGACVGQIAAAAPGLTRGAGWLDALRCWFEDLDHHASSKSLLFLGQRHTNQFARQSAVAEGRATTGIDPNARSAIGRAYNPDLNFGRGGRTDHR